MVNEASVSSKGTHPRFFYDWKQVFKGKHKILGLCEVYGIEGYCNGAEKKKGCPYSQEAFA
jgi:hypothetical protein